AREAEQVDVIAWLVIEAEEEIGVEQVLIEIGAGHAVPDAQAAERCANPGRVVDDLWLPARIARGDGPCRQRDIGERAAIDALPGAVAANYEALHGASRNTASSANQFGRQSFCANGAPARPPLIGTALSMVKRMS